MRSRLRGRLARMRSGVSIIGGHGGQVAGAVSCCAARNNDRINELAVQSRIRDCLASHSASSSLMAIEVLIDLFMPGSSYQD